MLEHIETPEYEGPDRRGKKQVTIPLMSLLAWSLVLIVAFNFLFMGAFFLDQHNRARRSSQIAETLVDVQSQQQCVADAQSRWDAAIGDLIAIQFSANPRPLDETTLRAIQTLKTVNDDLKRRQVAACYGDQEIPLPTTSTTEGG